MTRLPSLDLSARNLARQEEQFKIGAASQRDLDQARSEQRRRPRPNTPARRRG